LGALLGIPGGVRSFARGPEGYKRTALGMGIPLYGCSGGQPGVDSSTEHFEIWLKGGLEVGCFSLWELCEGNLEGRLLPGDPEGYVEKALETGIFFHRGPVWGTWRRARLSGTLRAG